LPKQSWQFHVSVIDAHIHIQPFHMMARTCRWQKKPDREELGRYPLDPRALLRRIDDEGPSATVSKTDCRIFCFGNAGNPGILGNRVV
jgi:hypothetical protein